nr:unnamed protein product [Callosobruchus chinensis]
MDDVIVAAGAFFLIHSLASKRKKKKTKKIWRRRLFARREKNALLRDMDSGHLKNFTRMTAEDFERLIILVGPKISKMDTKFRKAIPVQDRLAITLRFLATGDSFTSLQYLFKVSKQRISIIIEETCNALIQALKEQIKVTLSYYYINIYFIT